MVITSVARWPGDERRPHHNLKTMRPILLLLSLPLFAFAQAPTPPARLPHPPRAEWGAPLVNVSQSGATWTIAGRKNSITLNAADISMNIKIGRAHV